MSVTRWFRKNNVADSEGRNKLWLERSLMLAALTGACVTVYLYKGAIAQYLAPPVSTNLVYGTWVEQNVAPYARDEFEISPQGIIRRGAILTTSFEFDGQTLHFHYAGQDFRYRILDTAFTEMQLDSDDYYQPVFHKQGARQLSLR
ncbi:MULTISPECIES: DUF2850 domain-containing protein [unclassified Vibrio]|uniref:DUF2850 domain-containing protein n=1 Tax=Vibrio sp. HB236076 TaxID=3232307 RepID=A0AB39HGJ0_9VIBR|nr:DUF2850 domain-containing protein [Vibrio sp. HB161653]MDP5254902.1 DUF2850 domain-containing protein [Vibrio sp. HB161653]